MVNNDNSSYILTEIWKARSTWYDLSSEQRTAYFEEKIGPLLMGIMAVWKFPDKETSDQLESAVKEADFLEYFDQVNFSGNLISPPVLNESMINL